MPRSVEGRAARRARTENAGVEKVDADHVVSEEGERTPGGIGELWFDHMDALQAGMKSAEMGAAVEDAKHFLDMDKTYAVVVDEKSLIG